VSGGRAGLVFRYRRLRAALLLTLGKLEDAAAEARAVVDLGVELGFADSLALPMSVMVETAVRQDDIAGAIATLARHTSLASGVLSDLHWAEAIVADTRGDTSTVARALAPIRALLEDGNFFFVIVQHHRLPQLVHIGRRAAENHVRSALRALGVRKRRDSVAKPDQGWPSLTRSEEAVVELVARGVTNREAAGELFLSPDTVNTHLRHAFMKLGIRSRVELARLAAERERPAP
jgi:DNA-binding CsgD family transcriptional regulator